MSLPFNHKRLSEILWVQTVYLFIYLVLELMLILSYHGYVLISVWYSWPFTLFHSYLSWISLYNMLFQKFGQLKLQVIICENFPDSIMGWDYNFVPMQACRLKKVLKNYQKWWEAMFDSGIQYLCPEFNFMVHFQLSSYRKYCLSFFVWLPRYTWSTKE